MYSDRMYTLVENLEVSELVMGVQKAKQTREQ